MKNNPGRTILERIYYYFEDIWNRLFAKKEKIYGPYNSVDDMLKKDKQWKKDHPYLYQLREIYYEIFYRFPNKISRIPKEIKWFFQRGKRGWADCDTWNFFAYHSKVCKEALVHLKIYKMGYPAQFQESGIEDKDAEKHWNNILEKMICAFEEAEAISNMDTYMWYPNMRDMTDFSKKHNVKIQTEEEYKNMIEGFKLFFEHYWNLWD